jgi:hypothetical protein
MVCGEVRHGWGTLLLGVGGRSRRPGRAGRDGNEHLQRCRYQSEGGEEMQLGYGGEMVGVTRLKRVSSSRSIPRHGKWAVTGLARQRANGDSKLGRHGEEERGKRGSGKWARWPTGR